MTTVVVARTTSRPSINRNYHLVFDELRYLQRRCDEESIKASFCADDLMAEVHRELARLYQSRAERLVRTGQQDSPRLVAGVGEEKHHPTDIFHA